MTMLGANRTRIYPIQNDGASFYTGLTSGDPQRQVLMGLLCPELVAILFDLSGRMMEMQSKPIVVPRMAQHPQIYATHDPQFRKVLTEELGKWQTELGFRPATIHVRRFVAPGRPVGIFDRPESFDMFLKDPGEFFRDNDLTKRHMRETIKRWDSAGQFVLLWAKEFWMDPQGEVEST